MSSIYDNIEQPILPELQAYLKQAYRADFCVGYFNLRGWRQIDGDIEQFEGGEGGLGEGFKVRGTQDWEEAPHPPTPCILKLER
jgi:hypothetical protein